MARVHRGCATGAASAGGAAASPPARAPRPPPSVPTSATSPRLDAATIALTSSDPSFAPVPATFTIPALTIPGDTASVVTIDHPAVPEDRTVTLTATYGGRMLSADFPVPKSTDLVTINEAEQTLKDAQLKVEATGTIALATLSLYDDATGGFIGSMQLKGLLNAGGKFQFQGNVASVRTLRLVSTFGGVTRFNVSQKSLESELHSVTAMQGGSHIGVTSRA